MKIFYQKIQTIGGISQKMMKKIFYSFGSLGYGVGISAGAGLANKKMKYYVFYQMVN